MTKDKIKCKSCSKSVDHTSVSSCMTSHVYLNDYGLDDHLACNSDDFYCPDCLDEHGYCHNCSDYVTQKTQLLINKNFR